MVVAMQVRLNSQSERFLRADGSPRRVLYAEDQTSSRVVTKAMLERMGFFVDAVEDGELALAAARNDNYDIILLDIEMPVMDGVTAARSIRAEIAHCEFTPILALSAFLADSTESSVWRDAFDSALPKPANSNELMQAMVDALDLQQKLHDRGSVLPDDLMAALRLNLSRGSWSRLARAAADEMRHMACVMSAGLEAGDDATRHSGARHLIQLATSFGVMPVKSLVQVIAQSGERAMMPLVFKAIEAWEAA